MSERQAKAARRADRERLQEALLQAHDRLHKDDVDGCHDVLHRALALPAVSAEPVVEVAELVDGMQFDHAFIRLAQRHGARVAYVRIDRLDETKGVRLISGGDAGVCQLIDTALRAHTEGAPDGQ